MNYLKSITELQTQFFRQVSGFEKYKFVPKPRDVLLIVKFVAWGKKNYGKRFGIDFLIKFFEFQYSYYAGLKLGSERES